MRLRAKAKRAAVVARDQISFGVLEPARYWATIGIYRLSKRPMTPLLILSDGAVGTSEEQLWPIMKNRRTLARDYGLIVRQYRLSSHMRHIRSGVANSCIVGLKVGFRSPRNAPALAIEFIRESLGDKAQIIYFDGDDDLGIQWPDLLPHLSLYVKKHAFKDRSEYLVARVGKSNLTQYVAEHHGFDFTNDIIPESAPVASDQVGKIAIGWNIAFDRKIQKLTNHFDSRRRTAEKELDVICRATVRSDLWTFPLRVTVQAKLDKLGGDYRVSTPREYVSQVQYYDEMLASKICVSPFGYGEVCWRDFEAILCGCVLVKPDMSHVETYPNIYIPHVTYEPVCWDYSDLEEVIRRLVAAPDYCHFLRSNALAVVKEASCTDQIVSRIAAVIRSAGPSEPEVHGSS